MVVKRRLAAMILACAFLLTGCGGRNEKEAYSSPNFSKQESSTEETGNAASQNVAVATDTDGTIIEYGSLSDDEPIDMPELDEPINPEQVVGYYYNNDYYLPFGKFAIKTDGDNWRLYNAFQVSEVTDFTEEEVETIWAGQKSPYYLETTCCAVAYHFQSGSNIVVSYINPKLFWMEGLTAEKYLGMIAEEQEGLQVQEVTYLGRKYMVLDIPEELDGFGRRVQFVTEQDGLLISIVYTIQGDMTLEDMADHLVRLN